MQVALSRQNVSGGLMYTSVGKDCRKPVCGFSVTILICICAVRLALALVYVYILLREFFLAAKGIIRRGRCGVQAELAQKHGFA